MVNLIRKLGHIVKNSPKTVRNCIIISKTKYKRNFKAITINKNRNPKLVVSLTSYKKRFPTLVLCLKSLLNQTMLPDHIVLYLSKDEKKSLPNAVKALEKYGLEIRFVGLDLKPHKKYYYAMKEYPNDIIITVDDDVVYDKNLIKDLYSTYKQFPNCIISARAHKIVIKKGKIVDYSKWNQSYIPSSLHPSFLFMATGVGGVLYPPHLLNLNILLNLKYINKYIEVDDLWLKTVEIISGVPTVICGSKLEKNRIEIPSAQKVGLAKTNVDLGQNNIKLKELEKEFDITHKLIQKEKMRYFKER